MDGRAVDIVLRQAEQGRGRGVGLDDPAPGGPIEWAQIFSPDPVPDAELQRQAASLRALLVR